MEGNEEKENEPEYVKHAIWETVHDNQPLTLEFFEDASNSSSSSSVGLEIDTQEPSTSSKIRKRKRNEANIPEGIRSLEEEIEQQLSSKAVKSQLTVANVKNILRHVITNQHVLAMVKKTMKVSGDGASSDEEEDCPYGPKLTRAKTKELLKDQPIMPWPGTPSKQPASETQVLIEQELPDDPSDDEEYQPVFEEDLSDEEERSSLVSDLEQPVTPLSMPQANVDTSTQTIWTDDGLFRLPVLTQTVQESAENIGQRTRSKLSLSNTALETIEQSFVPPDITTDMYDLECDNEDWREFLKDFTQPLNSMGNDTLDDDEADPEYNILEDEEADDHEELRADRAVKVSKKELNELISELMDYMEPSDDEGEITLNNASILTNSITESTLQETSFISQENQLFIEPQTISSMGSMPEVHQANHPTQVPVSPQIHHAHQTHPAPQVQYVPQVHQLPEVRHESQVHPMPQVHQAEEVQELQQEAQMPPEVQEPINEAESFVEVTRQQRKLLAQQMRQHVQLLAQSYMQSKIMPEMKCCSLETKENLLSLKYMNGINPGSAFYASNLEDAIIAVEEWDEMLKEDNPISKELNEFTASEIEMRALSKKTKKQVVLRHPRPFLELVSQSKAFIYPLLLPHCAFRSRCDVSKRFYFSKSEDMLIALSLEQFVPYLQNDKETKIELDKSKKSEKKKSFMLISKAADLISELTLPAKTSKAVEYRINFLKKDPSSVIAMYFKNGQCPATVHYVIAVDTLAPCEQPRELLPKVWEDFIYQEDLGESFDN